MLRGNNLTSDVRNEMEIPQSTKELIESLPYSEQ
jgi:hypothetical protein